jgi:hypothetical protein
MGRADLYPRAKREDRTADGITFDSKREMVRYYELKTLLGAKQISGLKCHTKFTFRVGPDSMIVGTYKADFVYFDKKGNVVIEDVKAWRRTPKLRKLVPIVGRDYGIKKRLMKALFNLDVQEV